uniref:BstA-like C-terminal domain-containing protein n=1 Tax=Magnetococcus massalia (strain MO-1) TaxID=451514 RepID=A0A1S7LLJ9_MAGMO|nr:conserved protein of unknown function [Candidatus Magnetococcus massalia]
MAVLEYYAFEAKTPSETAVASYRHLARQSLREFVYKQVGFAPYREIPEIWKNYHARVAKVNNKVPVGYFSVFKELGDVIIDLISNGANVGPEFVPDISVGQVWSKHWNANNLAGQHGDRQKYEHEYPDVFPQAASGPKEVWCYPEAALPEYRRWMREVYLPTKLEKYLIGQVKRGTVPASLVEVVKNTYQIEHQ